MIKDGYLWAQGYSDEKCDKEEGSAEKLMKCDVCEKEGLSYVKTQCGTISTMILAIFLVLAFLF